MSIHGHRMRMSSGGPKYIPTPVPTPVALGSLFEGGYYMGRFWNEVAYSADTKVVSSSVKTQEFTVPDLLSKPLVYVGQTLEIRNTTNPVSYIFKCTVLEVKAASLIVQVDSVVGASTTARTGWHIMAIFRSIEAPKQLGERKIALRNENLATPIECNSRIEGWDATLAMVAAGNATEYPAAHWARSLTINGYNDWYVPGRNQRELSWRNAKPLNVSNYSSANRPVPATAFRSHNRGDPSDTSQGQGYNRSTIPTGARYTSSSPKQTTIEIFKSGGEQAFETAADTFYLTSSAYSATAVWVQHYVSGARGMQGYGNKRTPFHLRVVRRSIE